MDAIQSALNEIEHVDEATKAAIAELQASVGQCTLGWPGDWDARTEIEAPAMGPDSVQTSAVQTPSLPTSLEPPACLPPSSDGPAFLTWFPSGEYRSKTTAIVSSRLGRKLDRKDALFHVLRSACRQLDPQRQSLLTAAGTTTHGFVCRVSELFAIPRLEVHIAEANQSVSAWCAELVRRELPADEDDVCTRCYVSPLLDAAWQGPPVRDWIVTQCSDQLLVLHARARGNLEQLIQARVTRNARVYLALGDDDLVPHAVAEPLMQGGAIGWFLMRPESQDQSVSPLHARRQLADAPILTADQIPAGEYLTHCTRRAKGPWPDQTANDFLDELILGTASRDRSSLATLTRIVSLKRLIATSESIRGDVDVVSFTAASFAELQAMRVFRTHRGHWDFEPYGICVGKQVMLDHDARPVIYGDAALWDTLSTDQRPFFQKRSSRAGEAEGIDWSIEQEWRTRGAVDLRKIAADDAVVFVPTLEEAELVARWSRWPVAVCP